jgi:hypothetical protein
MAGDSQQKYLKNKTLAQVEKKKGDSHFWSRLMDVKKSFLERGRFSVQDGIGLDSGRIFVWAMSL